MDKKIKVLFVCTGNSCRSQMAEGLLRNRAGDKYEVFSAGTHPSIVHPLSIAVMKEDGIDISLHTSDHLNDYLDKKIDIVITVCDSARKICPVFPRETEHIHWSIADPFDGWDIRQSKTEAYRKTRETLKSRLDIFIKNKF